MATLEQLLEIIASIKGQQDTLNTKIDEFKLESTSAFNRLNQKVEEGCDVAPAIAGLAPIGQSFSDKTGELDSAIAEAKLEGQ